MKKNNNAAWGMLVTLLGGILWGFSGTCGQYIFQQEAASSQWVTCVRMLGAGVVLIALGLAKQGRSYAAVWRDKKDAAGLLLFAVLGLMFSQYTYMTAISYSNSGTTTALQCTGQVLVLIYSCILVRRWPTRLESVGVVLAVGGTFLLATHGKLGNLAISPLALAWGMASALSLALYTLLPVRLIKKYGSTVVTGWGMLIGGVVLYYLGIYGDCFTIHDFWQIRVPGWVGLVLAAIVIVVLFVQNIGKAAAHGKLLRVEAASPHRIEPDCPYFPACGGCDFRHISYEEELDLKARRVQDGMQSRSEWW